jgi:hypothetical protein
MSGKYLKNMNKNKFDRAFDQWLDSTPEYKTEHNPFTEILGAMIEDWPEVPKVL